jgi:hypothetical protein
MKHLRINLYFLTNTYICCVLFVVCLHSQVTDNVLVRLIGPLSQKSIHFPIPPEAVLYHYSLLTIKAKTIGGVASYAQSQTNHSSRNHTHNCRR